MTVITRLLSSKSVHEHNYVSPYIGLRDVCLNEDIRDVYYLEASHKYLCVYKHYISLSGSKQLYMIDSNTVWTKSVEGVKKVIPLNLRTIVCVYENYITVLDGLNCVEELVCTKTSIGGAFVYENRGLSEKGIRLGVVGSECTGVNVFESYKLPQTVGRESIDVRESISMYFFNSLSDDQISSLVSALPELILHIEVLEFVTQLTTLNYVWLVGSKKKLNRYKNTYSQLEVPGCSNVIVLFRPV